MSRSKVKATRDKNALCTPITAGSDGMDRARCKLTSRDSRLDHSVAAGEEVGVISAACVRFMFGKTSLALVLDLVFLQRAQCSHCKRCISYGNSVCPSVTRRYCVKTRARSTVHGAVCTVG